MSDARSPLPKIDGTPPWQQSSVADAVSTTPWYKSERPWNTLTSALEQATSRIPEGPAGIPGHVMGGVMSSLTGLLGQTENALTGRPVDPQAVTAGMMNFAAPELAARPQTGVFKTFGGVGAKTADMAALKEAQVLHATGATPQTVWDKTGWFVGQDGKWRFEIPDTDAAWTDKVAKNSFNEQLVTFGYKPRPVSDLLNHEKLFAAYPSLRDTPVTSTPPMSAFSGLRGAVYESGRVGLTGAKPEEAMSTLLHEMQHKVQGEEGFAPGGNPGQFMSNDLVQATKAIQAKVQDFERRVTTAGANPYSVRAALERKEAGLPLYPHHEDALRKSGLDLNESREFLVRARALDELRARQGEAFRKYENLPGERESRKVEERFKSGDYISPPWMTP